MRSLWKAPAALQIATLFLGSVVPLRGEEPAVFPLTESSIVDSLGDEGADPQSQMFFFRVVETQGTTCAATPFPDVVYPKLTSPSPLYGCLPLTNSGETVYFVVDESKPAAEPAAKEEPSLLRQLGEALTGSRASAGRAGNYDLLYVDINRDRDLTNDAALRPMKKPPKMFPNAEANPAFVVFDYVDIKPLGEGAEKSPPVRVLPWFTAADRQESYLVIMTTAVRKGRIRIGDTWYEAMMGTSLSGPAAALLVRPEPVAGAEPAKQAWKTLGFGLQQTDGGFFELTASAACDQITVAPYSGAMGELRVEPGDRKVEQFGAAGVIRNSTGSVVWLGETDNYYSEQRVRSIQLPAGDYQLNYLTVACGDLLVRLSANPQTVQIVGDAGQVQAAFPIAIREDKPFTLKFSDQAKMMFMTPPAGSKEVFRCGTTINLRAMLLDPALDSVVRGLDDATQKTGEQAYQGTDGQMRTVAQYASLVPQVSIVNAAGKEVASGTMPFG